MSVDDRQLELRVRELFDFLDQSIGSVQEMLSMLNVFRAALIRRDESTMRQMQDNLPTIAAQRQQTDSHLERLTSEFAHLLQCPVDQVSLTRIALSLPLSQRLQVQEKQQMLQSLVNRLHVEHRGTELLLRECERLNRLLLDGMIGKRNQTLTYTPHGQSRREMHRSIVSMRM
jgi:hypothetical protein